MQYLVIGANGYVGSYLYRRMKADGFDVIGTGHCREGEKELVYFDIREDSFSDITRLVRGEEKTAIICTAQAELDQCRTEYERSRQVNVLAVEKMVRRLVKERFHVIYFSSDNVFDGTKGNYTEQDETNPINAYGKMKEEVEHFMADTYPEVCVFRMPRVVGTEVERRNLLTDLESKLKIGEAKCIKGNRMSLIAKEDIYQACIIASQKKLQGLYNLSNGEAYSRKELAQKFYTAMEVDHINIVEWDLEQFGFQDKRPLNTSLNNTKFREITGYEFLTYDLLINRYLSEKRKDEKETL